MPNAFTHCPKHTNATSCYLLNATLDTYANHKANCAGQGGYLVSYNSAFEQLDVETQLPSLTPDPSTSGWYYIGLEKAGNVWYWADGGLPGCRVTNCGRAAGCLWHKVPHLSCEPAAACRRALRMLEAHAWTGHFAHQFAPLVCDYGPAASCGDRPRPGCCASTSARPAWQALSTGRPALRQRCSHECMG
jgi:hypothetical protein